MSFTAQDWKEDYERTKTLVIQLRSSAVPPSSQVGVGCLERVFILIRRGDRDTRHKGRRL
jgi:hypothetical protein